MNYGYQNELDFVNLFTNKFLNELDERTVKFLKELFEENIDNEEAIKCWKNHMVQKADIFIKYKNYVKSVSLKCGNSNSMHHEQLQEFKKYLGEIGIPYKIVDKYVDYHYGYAIDDKGRKDFSKRLSSEEYKKKYQNEIDIFNKYINKTKTIVDMIDRFIVRGRNSNYDIDALVCGTIDDYVWIMKYDLYDLILSKRCLDFTSPHIACMTIGPKKRDIEGNLSNRGDRYIVCVRWNFIKSDIINFISSK